MAENQDDIKKVLVVDDEESIVTLLSFHLEKAGYEVAAVMDGLSAYEKASSSNYDFIILDLMLPKMDGIEVCKKIRQEQIDVPIIMLTAKDDQIEKVLGLELGADDYMTKPFSPRELLARMKAISRRSRKSNEKEAKQTEMKIGDLLIYPDRYEAWRNGTLLELTPKEFELLVYMAQRLNRILSREQLLEAVWNYDFSGDTRIVDVHISHLREKIEAKDDPNKLIKTVRGFGYKLEG